MVLEGGCQISSQSWLRCLHSGLKLSSGDKKLYSQKRNTNHTSILFKTNPSSACTCVSIALVRVNGQIGQVCVGVLVRRSGHYKMYQAFSFTDGGDSFGVGHSRH